MADTHAENEQESPSSESQASSSAQKSRLLPESLQSFELQAQEVAGGRLSHQRNTRRQTNDFPDGDIEQLLEAIELLRDLAGDDEEILESESLYKWLTEIAREHFEAKEVEEAEEQLSDTDTEAEPNMRLENWLEEIFVQDLAAKIQGRIFVGGADEDDEVDAPTPCLYCNKSVGDEMEQHVLKCKFAHEEQERLDWTMRRNQKLRRRKL